METYSQQFPPEGASRTPCRRSKDRISDANEGSDGPGFDTHEGQPDRGAPEMDFTLWLSGVGSFGLQVKDIR